MSKNSDSVAAILHDRGLTNGPYDKMAATAQGIKASMRKGTNWWMLTPAKREALELIAHKMARILEGDPEFPDHWDDIGGYAKLGRDNGYTPPTDSEGDEA